jgi:protein-S-isoprenylcysteine O-methyltransferase Ste14
MAGHPGGRTLSLLQLAQRIRVPAGFVLAPLMLIAARPGRLSMTAGSMVALVGLGIRGWASGCLNKNERLATSGPYAYTRNPLYLGTFFLGLGIAICTGSWWFACIFGVFYLLIYIPVMMAEAETLQDLFPDEYPAYSSRVPLLVPRFTRLGSEPGSCPLSPEQVTPFDPSLYVRHREYRAALGLVAVLGILVLKAWLNL